MSNKTVKVFYWIITSIISLAIILITKLFLGLIAMDSDFPLFMVIYFGIMLLVGIGIISTLSIFVYRDALKRGIDPWVWMIIVAYVPNFIGLIIYLIMRNSIRKKCDNCGRAIEKNYKVCPYCGSDQGSACPGCRESIEDDWKVCPYCGENLIVNKNKVITNKKSVGKWIWALVSTMIIVIGLTVTFILMNVMGNITFGNYSIGKLETEGFSHTKASYIKYNGTKTRKISAKEGQMIDIEYECEINDGSLTILVKEADGDIVKKITEEGEGHIIIDVDEDMTYKLNIIGDNTSGKYVVEWEVK